MKATRVCADTSVVSRSHPVTECVGESNVTALADVASSRITPPTSILQNECCDAERFGKSEAFLHLYTTTSGYGYGYILGPSPVPPIYLAGSFGLVRPAWIRYTRSAVPQNVEGLTRPPRSAPAPPIPCTLAARPEGVDVVL